MTSITLPYGAAPTWQAVAATVAALPPTGIIGEVRLVLDTDLLYEWTGSAWVAIGGGSSGVAIGDTITSGTAGSVLFVGAGPVLAQDNANFFWDDTNNRLGLGVASPTSVLHTVASGSRTTSYSGNLLTNTTTSSTASIVKAGLEVSSTGTWNGSSAQNIGVYVSAVTGGTANYDAIFNGGGNVGIGTATPTGKLDVAGRVRLDGGLGIESNNTGNNYVNFLGGAGNIALATTGTSGVSILGSGRVGLGDLHLITWHSNSDGRGPGDTGIARNAAGVVEINNATRGTYRDIQIRAINPSSGSVGIGTTSPGTLLDVDGEITGQKINLTTDRAEVLTNQTSSAAAALGTLANAPAAGDPGFWLKVIINGTNYAIPCWAG